MGFSLKNESVLGFYIAFFAMIFNNWSGTGQLFTNINLISSIWYIGIFTLIGIAWSLFKWKKVVEVEIEKGKNEKLKLDDVKYNISRKKDYDTMAYWILL